jgi:hypothetical protein
MQRRLSAIAAGVGVGVDAARAATDTSVSTSVSAEQAVAAAKAAVLGNLVGDAAAVTSHWVYDQNTLAAHVAKLGGADNAPFMDPINPFYHVRPGQLSCYGDQTWALIQAMVGEDAGGVDVDSFHSNLTALMGGDSDYGPIGRVIAKEEQPIQGPWRHGSMKGYFANQADASAPLDDKQIDGACKMPPVVLQGGGDTAKMLALAEETIRITQDTDEAVAMGLAFARILESLVFGRAATPLDAVEQCIDVMRDEERDQPNPLDDELSDHLVRRP